jgi:RND family efflux transporter MFP subunit
VRVFVVVVLVLIAASVGIYVWRGAQPIAVQAVKVQRGSIEVGYDEDGYVRSEVEAVVAARISSRVKSIEARDGTPVVAGQTIATLDPSEIQAAIDAADAEVARARAVLDDTSVGVRTSLDAADAELAAARASLEAASARRDQVASGPRPEERERALAVRAQADAAVWEAQRQFGREQKLYKAGYVPQRQLDAAQSTLRQAQARQREVEAAYRLVDEGARVEEKRSAEAGVAQARAEVATAQARVDKAAAAQPQVAAARAALAAAEARARQARAQLHDVVLTAPSGGSLVLQDVKVGDVVAPGTVVARIVDPNRTWVETQIDERDVAGVHLGMAVRVTSDTWPDLTLDGRLVRMQGEAVLKRRGVTSAGREEDRVFKGRVEVQDPQHKLRPGMSVYAQIVTEKVKDVLLVPREAVVPEGAEWIAWGIRNGRAVKQKVTLGARDPRRVQVTSGLAEGDEVVIGGRELITDGCAVRVQKP